jgi:hypothetical protein
VSYTIRAIGWEDKQGEKHALRPDRDGNYFGPDSDYRGRPPALGRVYGILASIENPEDSEDRHAFWNFALQPFQSWDEWWTYIASLMAQHGMALADGTE